MPVFAQAPNLLQSLLIVQEGFQDWTKLPTLSVKQAHQATGTIQYK